MKRHRRSRHRPKRLRDRRPPRPPRTKPPLRRLQPKAAGATVGPTKPADSSPAAVKPPRISINDGHPIRGPAELDRSGSATRAAAHAPTAAAPRRATTDATPYSSCAACCRPAPAAARRRPGATPHARGRPAPAGSTPASVAPAARGSDGDARAGPVAAGASPFPRPAVCRARPRGSRKHADDRFGPPARDGAGDGRSAARFESGGLARDRTCLPGRRRWQRLRAAAASPLRSGVGVRPRATARAGLHIRGRGHQARRADSSPGCSASTPSASSACSASRSWAASAPTSISPRTLPPLPDVATYHEVAAATSTSCAAGTARRWPSWPPSGARSCRSTGSRPQLVHAFLAAEDRRFYEHGGIDYRGIAPRARRQPARRRGRAGRLDHHPAGGEVVPVVRSGPSSARSARRSWPAAWRRQYSKREILTLYLNQVFLGHGAYGVAAAARRYFDKPIERSRRRRRWRSLAGLVRAPSRFSPLTSLDAARARRDQVLAAMVASGYLTDDEANRWRARPVIIRQRPDYFHTVAPYFAEHVRRDIVRRYGEKKLLRRAASTSRPPFCPGSTSSGAGERRLLAAQARQAAGLARAGGAPRPAPPPTSSAAASPPATAASRRPRGASTSASSRGRPPTAATACASARASTRCPPAEHAVGRPLQRQGRRQRQDSSSRRSACCAPATSSG